MNEKTDTSGSCAHLCPETHRLESGLGPSKSGLFFRPLSEEPGQMPTLLAAGDERNLACQAWWPLRALHEYMREGPVENKLCA